MKSFRSSALAWICLFTPATLLHSSDALIEQLVSRDYRDRSEAAEQWAAMGPFERRELIPGLVEKLATPDATTASWAADALAVAGADAVEPIVQFVQQRRGEPGMAVDALARMGPAGVSGLEKMFLSGDTALKYQVIRAAGDMKRPSGDFSSIYILALQDGDSTLREKAATVLGKDSSSAWQARTALGQALRDPEPLVRSAAASALGRIGSSADPWVPALRDAVNDMSYSIPKEVVIGALKRINSDTAWNALDELGVEKSARQEYDTRKSGSRNESRQRGLYRLPRRDLDE